MDGVIGSITNPVNSEDFLPPAACRHRRGDMEFVKAQNADRERMVCAVGLDVHYELNVIAQEAGSYRPRLKPFNPRMSGPACPYNYTGKFLPEADYRDVCDDPIELGRKVHALQAYDPALYRKYDPRKVSKTVIVRDYGCKVPITLADTGRIAQAVLNHYPDQYVSFLGEFVSNTFGASMRAYLTTYQKGLREILAKPQEMNRISWAAYKSVQGGGSPFQSLTGDKGKHLTAPQVLSNDATLPWDDHLGEVLKEVIRTGETMSGALNPGDVFNLTDCLHQHIATLDDMINVWCRGFATKERFALAMIVWLNEQGRNMTQDLRLLQGSSHPNYNLIELHVPVNPFHMADAGKLKTPDPDQNCSIRRELFEDPNKDVHETMAFRYPVGQWTGNGETANVVLGAGRSPYMWGWGHPANLTINIPVHIDKPKLHKNKAQLKMHVMASGVHQDKRMAMCAPFLKYKIEECRPNIDSKSEVINSPLFQDTTIAGTGTYEQSNFKLADAPCSKEFVVKERWGTAYTGGNNGAGGRAAVEKHVIDAAHERTGASLRDVLGQDDDVQSTASFYRGSTVDDPYRAVMKTYDPVRHWNITMVDNFGTVPPKLGGAPGIINYKTCETDERATPRVPQDPGSCGPDGHSVVHVSFSAACKVLDPFFTSGSNCIITTVPGEVTPIPVIDARAFGYYDIAKIGPSSFFRDVMSKAMTQFAAQPQTSTSVDSVVSMYQRSGAFYPFRTIVPPFMLQPTQAAAHPIMSNALTSTDVHLAESTNAQLKINGHALGHVTPVTNQPFIGSFTVDMKDVDWTRTASAGPGGTGKTDLLMNHIKPMQGKSFMQPAMRILAIRTVLSTLFGMDTTSLICAEPIPTNRPVLFYVTYDPVGGALQTRPQDMTGLFTPSPPLPPVTPAPALVTSGAHFTERHVPNETYGSLASWRTNVWKQLYPNSKVEDGRFKFVRENGTEATEEEAQDVLYRSMLIIILERLRHFLGLVTAKMPVATSPLTQTEELYEKIAQPKDKEAHLKTLFDLSKAHFLHLGIVANNPTTQNGAPPLGTTSSVRKVTAKAVKDAPTFPYDMAYHGKKINVNETPGESIFVKTFNALRIPPNAFYAFNHAEFENQDDDEMYEPFRETNNNLDEHFQIPPAPTVPLYNTPMAAIPTVGGGPAIEWRNLAAMNLLAHYDPGDGTLPPAGPTRRAPVPALLNPAAGGVGETFKKACDKYVGKLVDKAVSVLGKKEHYLSCVKNLVEITVTPSGETKYTGVEEDAYRAAPLPVPGSVGPVFPPIAMLENTGGDDGLATNGRGMFPLHLCNRHSPYHIDYTNAPSETERAFMIIGGPVQRKFEHGFRKFSLIPVGNDSQRYSSFDDPKSAGRDSYYNTDVTRPQMFAMLDAAGLLWHARAFTNPADNNRPVTTEAAQVDGMHYWCRTLAETFVSARESYRQRNANAAWEADVKKYPGTALPATLIGNLCDDTWKTYFPLLPYDHDLREDLRRARALSILWGTLPTYTDGGDTPGQTGAWMPLAPAHQMRLYATVGLFSSHKYHVPTNPWIPGEGSGADLVFMQSYHSAYHCDSFRAQHFQDWLQNACRYQVPHMGSDGCIYPFSQYGGTPVEADFTPHRVERCLGTKNLKRHSQLVYNRFGFTRPLRIGQQYHDTGLLQDMFQYQYRTHADLTSKQRAMPRADATYISNFLSYARNHAILALASCNHGTEDASQPRIVRNLYRLYVDTYECMGSNPDDDSVPVIMGFEPTPVDKREDRPVVLYAGSLACLNSKLTTFCNSAANKGEKVCAMYKQVYLNDATLLFTRLLRQERRKILHDNNFTRAQMKRGGRYTRDDFNVDLIDLQDAYIEFLQSTVLGMLIESGADLNGVPLHLLEPRELEVSLVDEDSDVVGNDFLTPRTREIIAQSDFGGDNLGKTQLAILSLIPPNHRVLGTLRLNQSMSIVDLEHAKKQIQRETMEANKKVWQKYSEQLIGAAFGQKFLAATGQSVDFSIDMSSVQDPMKVRFDMGLFKDPLKESENIKSRMTTTHAQSSSSLSLQARSDKLRKDKGPDSVMALNTNEWTEALTAVRARVERDYRRNGGARTRLQCFALLKMPEHVRRALRSEYEG